MPPPSSKIFIHKACRTTTVASKRSPSCPPPDLHHDSRHLDRERLLMTGPMELFHDGLHVLRRVVTSCPVRRRDGVASMLRVHRRGSVIRRSPIRRHRCCLIRGGAAEVAEKSVDVHLLGLVPGIYRSDKGSRGGMPCRWRVLLQRREKRLQRIVVQLADGGTWKSRDLSGRWGLDGRRRRCLGIAISVPSLSGIGGIRVGILGGVDWCCCWRRCWRGRVLLFPDHELGGDGGLEVLVEVVLNMGGSPRPLENLNRKFARLLRGVVNLHYAMDTLEYLALDDGLAGKVGADKHDVRLEAPVAKQSLQPVDKVSGHVMGEKLNVRNVTPVSAGKIIESTGRGMSRRGPAPRPVGVGAKSPEPGRRPRSTAICCRREHAIPRAKPIPAAAMIMSTR